MNRSFYHNAGEKLFRDDLEIARPKLPFPLPSDYIEFIQSHNGCILKNNHVGGKPGFGVREFFAFDRLPELVDMINSDFPSVRRGGLAAIPFAGDSSGNYWLLCADCSIVFLDHETGDIRSFAKSFSNWMGSIVMVDMQTDIPSPKAVSGWTDPEFLKELKKTDPDILK